MTPAELKNLPILATALQLICIVTLDVMGKDTAGDVGGEPVTQDSVKLLGIAALNKALSEK